MNSWEPVACGTVQDLVSPQCVAVLGVTDRRPNWASRALRQSAENGYPGALYGVNRRGALEGFDGLSIVRDLAEIEAPIDCALIGLGREQVLDGLESCARHGVKSVVVVAAGFGELGTAGRQLEQAMLSIAQSNGMRILGPNGIGLFRAGGVCFTPFRMPPGDVGLISQSGNVAISLGLQAERMGFGFSTCVGVGNQIDISFGELLSWFADDAATRTVAMYAEGIPARDAANFVEGLRRCHHANKPVFVLRGGSTPDGAAAAGTHTGSLASDAKVWSKIVEREHAISVTSESGLADALLAAQLPPFDGGVVVLTDGGGNSVMATDSLHRHGLPMAQLERETQAALGDLVPPLAPRHAGLNPLTMDTPGGLQDDPQLLARCAEICSRDDGVGALVVGGLFGGFADHRDEEVATARRLGALRQAGMAVAVASSYAGIDEGSLSELRSAGIPVYGCIDRLAAAIASRYQPASVVATDRNRGDDPDAAPVRDAGRWLAAREAIKRLSDAGLPAPAVRVVGSSRELEAATQDIGLPLCLKIETDQVAHKSDVGGVKLGLASPAEVTAAAAELWTRFADAELLVMPMFASGLELLAGLAWDPVFGPFVVVGRGGIWTEVENDVVVLPLALGDVDIAAELSQLRCFPMINGGRGQPSLDLKALVNLVSALGNLAEDDERLSVDLNPVILYEDGLAIADFRMEASRREVT